MGSDGPLEQALALPTGARFRRAALQVNPFNYLEAQSKQTSYTDASDYHDAIVAACLDNDIEVIAVTDHFEVDDTAADLLDRARAAGIVAFPGFEAKSSDGVHVLAIFDPSTRLETVRSYVGACGIHSPDERNDPAEQTLTILLGRVRDWGGVAIVNLLGVGGLFDTLRGQPRTKAWRHDDLLAVTLGVPLEELAENYRRIVVGKDKTYRRDHEVARVNACDVFDPSHLAEPRSWCYLKMAGDGIESLRQAFLDPGSRVLSSFERLPQEYPRIDAVAWEGGFLDGQRVRLSQNLNVLIGGRGAGKSTVIESLRFALGLEPIGDEASKLHRGFVEKVLRPGTTVSLAVTSTEPAEKHYRIERTVGDPPRVYSEAAKEAIQPRDTLPRLVLLGQHEIAELASDPARRLPLLERFVPVDHDLDQRGSDARRALRENSHALADAETKLGDLDDELERLATLEERLERFVDAGLEGRLERRTQYQTEEALLDRASERLDSIEAVIADLADEVPVDLNFIANAKTDELPSSDLLERARKTLDTLNRQAVRSSTTATKGLIAARTELADLREQWQKRRDDEHAELDRLLRDVQAERADAKEFLDVRHTVERLRPQRERRVRVAKQVSELKDQRTNLLDEAREIERGRCNMLEEAADEVSKRLLPRVRVEVRHWGATGPLEALFQARSGGQVKRLLDRLAEGEPCSPAELAATTREGVEALQKAFGVTKAQARVLSGLDEDSLRELEALELRAAVDICLNVRSDTSGPHQWRSLEDLSTGQKATAILLVLLLESDCPLIVDQPEDDLDNQFVTESVVTRIREAKQRRQFLFSTHNANIPVLGDAEQILVVQARGDATEQGAGELAAAGSIDTDGVRAAIEQLLEGGRAAFETRRRRYGF